MSPGRLASTLLLPLAGLYAAGARVHRICGRALARRSDRPACAVVSVGGLTLGGAGKTPLAARIAAGLARRGHRVVLASRGYGGRSRSPVLLVSDGARSFADAAVAGDEALVLAGLAPGVPVLVGRDRRRVAHHAVSALAAEIVVLDDGFQHHRLRRDLDIVCVDAQSGLGNGRVVPAGPLREARASIADADWLCLMGSTGEVEPARSASDLVSAFEASGRPVHRALRRPCGLRQLGSEARPPLASLAGRRVGLVCAIARPEGFRRMVESLGAEVVSVRCFRDHHRYRPRDLAGLADEAALWVTTEKDAVKLRPEWLTGVELQVLSLALELENEEAFFAAIEAAIEVASPAAGARR